MLDLAVENCKTGTFRSVEGLCLCGHPTPLELVEHHGLLAWAHPMTEVQEDWKILHD